MAWGITSAPGTPLGPCVEECTHRDCAAAREEAAMVCAPCGKPIGFDRPWWWVEGKAEHVTCTPAVKDEKHCIHFPQCSCPTLAECKRK